MQVPSPKQQHGHVQYWNGMNDTMNAKDVCSTNLTDVDNSAQGLPTVQFFL